MSRNGVVRKRVVCVAVRPGRAGRSGAAGMLALLALVALAAAGEARAERGARIGPTYNSPEAVRFVQRVLEHDRLLAPGAAKPGELDQPTIDAIRRFQRAHFLRPSGRIDPDTMAMMTEHGFAGAEPTASTAARSAAAIGTGRGRRGADGAGAAAGLAMPQTDLAIAPPPGGAPRALFARLRVPRLGIETRVVEGTDPASLAFGPGHLVGSAAPGADGNCVIAGHRSGVLGRLHELRAGDRIEVEGPAGAAAYRVGRIEVVDKSDVRPLRSTASPVLTLITCHPLRHAGPAPQRLVVRADRVEGAHTAVGAAVAARGREARDGAPIADRGGRAGS